MNFIRKQVEKAAVKAMYTSLKVIPQSFFNTGELLAWDSCKQAYGLDDMEMGKIMNKVRRKLGYEPIWGEIPDDFEEQKKKVMEENRDEYLRAQKELMRRRN